MSGPARLRLERRAGVGVLGALVLSCAVGAAADPGARELRAPLTLAANGASPYVIAKWALADRTEAKAASDLQSYLQRISGVSLPIVAYASLQAVPPQAVVIGSLVTNPPLAAEQLDMRTDHAQLILRGGSSLAHRYAVFTFLEEKLGCRFYAPTVERIPSNSTVSVEPYRDLQSPAFGMRYIYQQDASKFPEWCVRNKVNGTLQWACQENMYTVVPPRTYFKSHPEYYPLNKHGVRAIDDSGKWLCFSNPDLPGIIASWVTNQMAHTGSNQIVSVAQGDWYPVYCQCAACKAALAAEGGHPSGLMIRCLNAAAEIVARHYPDRKIGTLAYMHTAQPGATGPRPNIVVQLVHWGCCDVHGLEECSANRTFTTNVLAAWQAKTAPGQLFVWHYVAAYNNQLLSPWPNVRSLVPSLHCYHDHGVAGVALQGNYVNPGCDLSALKQYLMAKALWNANADGQAVYRDFMAGYYGAASGAMDGYVSWLEDRQRTLNWHPDAIFKTASIRTTLLPDAALEQTDRLFDAAEQAARGAGTSLYDRVHADRIGLLFLHVTDKHQLSEIASPVNCLVKDGDYRYLTWFDDFLATVGTRGWSEWGQAHAYQRGLAPAQGGRLITLENEVIKLKVCPNIQGAIVSLIDKRTGAELLKKAQLADAPRTYPRNGYYVETGLGLEAADSCTVTTDGGTNVLTIVTTNGNTAWGPSSTRRQTEAIRLGPGSTREFTVSTWVKNLTAKAPFTNLTLTGCLALDHVADYAGVVVVDANHTPQTLAIASLPIVRSNVTRVAYEMRGNRATRITQVYSTALPPTTLTVRTDAPGIKDALAGQYSTGAFELLPGQEKEVLRTIWRLD